jgi:O-antigen/teichoic acid export membrane protein
MRRALQTAIRAKISASTRIFGGLFSTSALLMAARVVGLGAGFGAQILLARFLEPEGLGIFYFATSIAYVVSMIAAFGYPVVAVRFISRYRVRGKAALNQAFVNRAQRDTAIVSFVAMAVVMLPAAVVPGDVTTRLAVAAAAIGIPAWALSRIYASVAGAIREFALSYVLNLLWRPILFLAVMGFAALVFTHPSPIVASGVFSFVAVVIVALQFKGLMRHFPGMLGSTAADRRQVYQWRLASAPLLILAGFSSLINDLNLALLGTIVSKADLAVFGVCLKLAVIVEYAISLVHELSAPDISDALGHNKTATVESVAARANIAAVGVALASLVGVVMFGRFALAAFGPDFVRALPILVVLVACQLIRAAFGPTMLTLISAGAQKNVVVIFSIAIVGYSLANLVLVPMFGLNGAAAAFAAMTAFWTVALALITKRKTGLRLDIAASVEFLRRGPFTLASLVGGAYAGKVALHPRN